MRNLRQRIALWIAPWLQKPRGSNLHVTITGDASPLIREIENAERAARRLGRSRARVSR